MWECSSFISISSSEGQHSFYGSTPPGTALWRQARHVSTWASSNRKLAYSPECVEGEFSEDEMRRPTPYAVPLGVCKRSTGFNGPNGRRIGPPWMVAKTNH